MNFASDTWAPAHPKVLEALHTVNAGCFPAYGDDASMERVTEMIRDMFEAPQAAVYLVSTGTAANSLALATYAMPWSAIYCHELAHIDDDECGGPEFFTGGAKLVLLPGKHGKVLPSVLSEKLAVKPRRDVHKIQNGVLSLTNVTELGAVYSAAEISALADVAKSHDLPVHLDGARFSNAIVASGATPAEMTWKAGVDVVSFGGSKNGLMGVEAVVLFDPDKAWEFELRRKRAGHLVAKHRYLSAQMEAYLSNNLWRELAENANAQGAYLAKGLGSVDGAWFVHPQEANMMFCAWDRPGHDRARAANVPLGSYTIEGRDGRDQMAARLVTNWSTTTSEVDQFVDLIAQPGSAR